MAKKFNRPARTANEHNDTTELYFYNGMPYAFFNAQSGHMHLCLPYEFLRKNEYRKYSCSFKGFMQLARNGNEDDVLLAEHWAHVMFGKPLDEEMLKRINEYWKSITEGDDKRTVPTGTGVVLVDKEYKKVIGINYDDSLYETYKLLDRDIRCVSGVKDKYLALYGTDEYVRITAVPNINAQSKARDVYSHIENSQRYYGRNRGICLTFQERTCKDGVRNGHIVTVEHFKNGERQEVEVFLSNQYGQSKFGEIFIAHKHEDFQEFQKKSWGGTITIPSVLHALIHGGTHDEPAILLYKGKDTLDPEAAKTVSALRYRMAHPSEQFAENPLKRILFNKEDPAKVIADAHKYLCINNRYVNGWMENEFNPCTQFVEWGGQDFKDVPRRSFWPKTAMTMDDWECENERKVY